MHEVQGRPAKMVFLRQVAAGRELAAGAAVDAGHLASWWMAILSQQFTKLQFISLILTFYVVIILTDIH